MRPSCAAPSALRGADPNSRLTSFEIVVHGLADGIGLYVLLAFLWPGEGPKDLVEPSLALLVVLLSVLVMVRRFRPEIRALRLLELGLSGLVAGLGTVGAVASVFLLVSGAMYKGNSPDAGGMAVMVGFLFFYQAAALFFLPFGLNASHLSSPLRHRIWWLCILLGLLPVCLLLGLSLLRLLLPGRS